MERMSHAEILLAAMTLGFLGGYAATVSLLLAVATQASADWPASSAAWSDQSSA
jgi:hypothetical protein